jgi:hypothetical protein
MARTHPQARFPAIPGRYGYGRQLRAQTGLRTAVIGELARDLITTADEMPTTWGLANPGSANATCRRCTLARYRQPI